MRDRIRQRPGPQRGQLAGPNPTDRGKKGSKIHLLVDRRGLPLSIGISAANLHDSQALIPLVRGIPPIRSRRGLRRRWPSSRMATQATTIAACDDGLLPAAFGTVSPARASSRPDTWAGIAGPWSGPCPGCPAAVVSVVATSKPEHFPAFTATLICNRRLTSEMASKEVRVGDSAQIWCYR